MPRPGTHSGKGDTLDGFLTATAISFGVIFVAELGDKSQLMALTFATRFRPLPVLIGITAATALVHLASGGHRVGDRAAPPTPTWRRSASVSASGPPCRPTGSRWSPASRS